MGKWVVMVLSFPFLVACGIDRGECLESHRTTLFIPVMSGKVTVMVPQIVTVCDRWEFPDGVTPVSR